MKRLIRRGLGLLGLLAMFCRAAPPIAEEPTVRLELAPAVDGCPSTRSFHLRTGQVEVEGTVCFEPQTELLCIEGEYRSREDLDPLSRLSFQLYSGDRQLLEHDGNRFDWDGPTSDGVRRAPFRIECSIVGLPGRETSIRIQFNYVVEGGYWFRDKFPEVELPQLAVRCPERGERFGVLWAWIPPVLPRRTKVWLPTLVYARPVGRASQFQAELDVLRPDSDERIEVARIPLPREEGGLELVRYRFFANMDGATVRMRPGFVWDKVIWYPNYAGNPYQRVRLVGPFTYLAGGTFLILLIGTGWVWVWRRRPGMLRRSAIGVMLVASGATAFLLPPSPLMLFAAFIAAFFWLQARIPAAAARLYWTLWLWLAAEELYWACFEELSRVQWSATLISVCGAAVLLLPLRLMRHPLCSALVGTVLLGFATLVVLSLTVYFSFFHDYPGLRDLMYSDQLGNLGDSLRVLLVQDQLLPCWLTVVACAGLWLPVLRPHSELQGA